MDYLKVGFVYLVLSFTATCCFRLPIVVHIQRSMQSFHQPPSTVTQSVLGGSDEAFLNDPTHILSHDEIEALVRQRDAARRSKNYNEADRIKSLLEEQCVEISDQSWKVGGASTWVFKVKKRKIDQPGSSLEERKSHRTAGKAKTNIIKLCHNCFQLLVDGTLTEDQLVLDINSQLDLQHYQPAVTDINMLLTHDSNSSSLQALEGYQAGSFPKELRSAQSLRGKHLGCLSTEMQGRKYADAAFELALAGVSDEALFERLAHCAASELRRFGTRPSCGDLHVHQIAERLAAAGVRSDHPVFEAARSALHQRGSMLQHQHQQHQYHQFDRKQAAEVHSRGSRGLRITAQFGIEILKA